jgi:hypothetical protein
VVFGARGGGGGAFGRRQSAAAKSRCGDWHERTFCMIDILAPACVLRRQSSQASESGRFVCVWGRGREEGVRARAHREEGSARGRERRPLSLRAGAVVSVLPAWLACGRWGVEGARDDRLLVALKSGRVGETVRAPTCARGKNCPPPPPRRRLAAATTPPDRAARKLLALSLVRLSIKKKGRRHLSTSLHTPVPLSLSLSLSLSRNKNSMSKQIPALLPPPAPPPVHFKILVTTPAATVLPPSRTANLNPLSIATGVIKSNSAVNESPGITIGRSSGSLTVPVTSAVRK